MPQNKFNAHAAYPIHTCKIHSHLEGFSTKVNALREVSKKLMVEGLNPICISAL